MARLQSEMQRQAASLKTKNKNPNQMEEVWDGPIPVVWDKKNVSLWRINIHCKVKFKSHFVPGRYQVPVMASGPRTALCTIPCFPVETKLKIWLFIQYSDTSLIQQLYKYLTLYSSSTWTCRWTHSSHKDCYMQRCPEAPNWAHREKSSLVNC